MVFKDGEMEYQFQGESLTNSLILFSSFYSLFTTHLIFILTFIFLGAHADIKKTKELQEQGKKINLSLSEMSQFFMKMAEAVIKKKLIPGMSIPGCCSFFLCKYLKDTMLQVRT